MPLAADYPFLEIVWTMIIFFAWVAWIWTLVMVLSDVFRRDDLSGWGKGGWTLVLILVPFLGVLIYLIAHGQDMGERRLKETEQAMARAREHYAAMAPAGGGAVSQIEEAKRLLDSGAIDAAEYAQLKAKALA